MIRLGVCFMFHLEFTNWLYKHHLLRIPRERKHMLSPNASSDIPSEKPKSHRMYDNRFLRVRKQVSHLGSVFLSSLLSWQKTWADRTDRNNKQSLAHGVRVCSPGLLGHVVFDPEEHQGRKHTVPWKCLSRRQEAKRATGKHLQQGHHFLLLSSTS